MSSGFVFFFCLILYATSLYASDNLKKNLLFYEDCENMGSDYPGVKISSSVQVEPEGKFGKCLRIERRTFNSLDNGDLAKKESDSLIYKDNAFWKESGGIDNSSCLLIKNGEVAIPVIDIKQGYSNAFSFFIKKADDATKPELKVQWKTDARNNILLENFKPRTEWERITLTLVSDSDSGTVILSVDKGAILIDNAQIDKGAGFFNQYSIPLKRRDCDWIEIPADSSFFNPSHGAISCWLNVPWIDASVTSSEICGIFAVKNAPEKISKWGDHNILVLSASPKRKKTDRPGIINAFTIDAENRIAILSESLNNIPFLLNNRWHLIVYNWKLKDGIMSISLNIDNGKVKLNKEQPFGPVKIPKLIYIGYCDGAYLNGLIDDFAIFSEPLIESEIDTIYSSGKSLSELTQ